MNHSQARAVEATMIDRTDARGIRRHLEELEQQVQQLRQRIDPVDHVSQRSELVGPISYRKLRAIIAARRARDRYFSPNLFSDPAWDILLELYATEMAQLRMTVSQLCVAAAVPSTTALRWIGTLERSGLIERIDDPLDRRRVFVRLTDKGRSGLDGYFNDEDAQT